MLSDEQIFGISEAEGGKFIKLDPSTYPTLSSYFPHGQYALLTYEANDALSIDGQDSTVFEEVIGAEKNTIINIKPTWGVSILRDTLTTTATGEATFDTGEICLGTGADPSGSISLVTNQRGQYLAGTTGQCGVGIRIPFLPTGNQYAEWGYFDDDNGYGYGVDATGVYNFVLDGGTQEKVYQNQWDVDKLNGKGDSGRILELSSGNIFEIDFVWYGYGEIDYRIIQDNQTEPQKQIQVHREGRFGKTSITDPNQPITVKVDNAGTASDFQVYVGGRQFSIISGTVRPDVRNTPIEIEALSVESTSYEPALSIRLKRLLNGRTNSIRASLLNVTAVSDQKVWWYASLGDVTDTTYGPISDVLSSETALEVGVPLSAVDETNKRALVKDVVPAGGRAGSNKQDKTERIPIGYNDELVIWIKKGTASNATVDVIITLEEEW